jgi:hypothetical protein
MTAAEHAGVALAALDYEIVAVAASAAVRPDIVGDFRDVHLRDDATVFRYVAGYLSFESGADAGAGPLLVRSHGRLVAALTAVGASISLAFEGSAIIDGGRIILPDAGLGIVPAGSWELDGDALLLDATGEPARALIAHGPARAKVHARMALAESLYAVGGRRG